MSRIGVATPWDDFPYTKSNANTFVRARAYRVFLTLCVGINLGGIPRGLWHPRDVPLVDPSTPGRKTLYKLATLKYCYNAQMCVQPLANSVHHRELNSFQEKLERRRTRKEYSEEVGPLIEL